LANLAIELVDAPAKLIDLSLGRLAGAGLRRRGDRFYLEPQSPIAARPGERQGGNCANTDDDHGEHHEPTQDIAPTLARNRSWLLAKFFIECIELRHFRRLQWIRHTPLLSDEVRLASDDAALDRQLKLRRRKQHASGAPAA
jgi:hypothetical protein